MDSKRNAGAAARTATLDAAEPPPNWRLQEPGGSPPREVKPAFDVDSVKPSLPGSRQQLTIQRGGRLSANEFSLEALIAICHHLAAYQLSGAEGWMKADRWSIEAKAEDVTQIPGWSPPYLPEVMAVRLRALLDDRFSLKVHRETRELKAYSLTIGRGGSNLVEFDPASQSATGLQSSPQPVPGRLPAEPTPRPGSIAAGPGVIIASAVTMDRCHVKRGGRQSPTPGRGNRCTVN